MQPIDPTIATVPDAPEIEHFMDSFPIQTATNINVTPKFVWNDSPNPKPDSTWVRMRMSAEYAKKLFPPSMMVGNGHENCVFQWYDPITNMFRVVPTEYNRWSFDQKLEGTNFSDPFQEDVARGIALLSQNATYWGCQTHKVQQVVLDIEETATYNGPTDKIEQLVAAVTAWKNRFEVYRAALWPNQQLLSYFYRGFAYKKQQFGTNFPQLIDQQAMRLLSGYLMGAYSTDETWRRPGSWFDNFDAELSYIKENYPFMKGRVWAALNPLWRMNDGVTPPTGTPVPFDLWTSQLRYAAKRGVHHYYWNGGDEKLNEVQAYLNHAAGYVMPGTR